MTSRLLCRLHFECTKASLVPALNRGWRSGRSVIFVMKLGPFLLFYYHMHHTCSVVACNGLVCNIEGLQQGVARPAEQLRPLEWYCRR